MKIHLQLMKINYSKKKEEGRCRKDCNSNTKHKQLQLKRVKPHQQVVKIILSHLKTNLNHLQFNISQLERQYQTLRKAMQVLYSSHQKSTQFLKYILLIQWLLVKFHYQIEIKTWPKNQLHQMYILPIQILLSYKYTDLHHAHLCLISFLIIAGKIVSKE